MTTVSTADGNTAKEGEHVRGTFPKQKTFHGGHLFYCPCTQILKISLVHWKTSQSQQIQYPSSLKILQEG